MFLDVSWSFIGESIFIWVFYVWRSWRLLFLVMFIFLPDAVTCSVLKPCNPSLFLLPLATVWSLIHPRVKVLKCCSFTQMKVFPNACGLHYLCPCKGSYKIFFISSNTDFHQSVLVHWPSLPFAYGTQNFFGQSFDSY